MSNTTILKPEDASGLQPPKIPDFWFFLVGMILVSISSFKSSNELLSFPFLESDQMKAYKEIEPEAKKHSQLDLSEVDNHRYPSLKRSKD